MPKSQKLIVLLVLFAGLVASLVHVDGFFLPSEDSNDLLSDPFSIFDETAASSPASQLTNDKISKTNSRNRLASASSSVSGIRPNKEHLNRRRSTVNRNNSDNSQKDSIFKEIGNVILRSGKKLKSFISRAWGEVEQGLELLFPFSESNTDDGDDDDEDDWLDSSTGVAGGEAGESNKPVNDKHNSTFTSIITKPSSVSITKVTKKQIGTKVTKKQIGKKIGSKQRNHISNNTDGDTNVSNINQNGGDRINHSEVQDDVQGNKDADNAAQEDTNKQNNSTIVGNSGSASDVEVPHNQEETPIVTDAIGGASISNGADNAAQQVTNKISNSTIITSSGSASDVEVPHTQEQTPIVTDGIGDSSISNGADNVAQQDSNKQNISPIVTNTGSASDVEVPHTQEQTPIVTDGIGEASISNGADNATQQGTNKISNPTFVTNGASISDVEVPHNQEETPIVTKSKDDDSGEAPISNAAHNAAQQDTNKPNNSDVEAPQVQPPTVSSEDDDSGEAPTSNEI